jgi:hypothetical protein
MAARSAFSLRTPAFLQVRVGPCALQSDTLTSLTRTIRLATLRFEAIAEWLSEDKKRLTSP